MSPPTAEFVIVATFIGPLRTMDYSEWWTQDIKLQARLHSGTPSAYLNANKISKI